MTLEQRKLEAAGELARIYMYLYNSNSQLESCGLIMTEYYRLMKAPMADFRTPWVSTYVVTRDREQGAWVPACGGTEVPLTTRTGRRLLYCWQPLTGDHAYIDLATDMVLSYDEAAEALR